MRTTHKLLIHIAIWTATVGFGVYCSSSTYNELSTHGFPFDWLLIFNVGALTTVTASSSSNTRLLMWLGCCGTCFVSFVIADTVAAGALGTVVPRDTHLYAWSALIFFGIPALWAVLLPESVELPSRWGRFLQAIFLIIAAAEVVLATRFLSWRGPFTSLEFSSMLRRTVLPIAVLSYVLTALKCLAPWAIRALLEPGLTAAPDR
jgi:hypothetical protein